METLVQTTTDKLMTELEKCELAKAKGTTYNSITGEVTTPLGRIVKAKSRKGYLIFFLRKDSKKYMLRLHRLAWYLHYGELPKNHVDHIDGNKLNNKIDNLRDITNHENQFNKTTAKGYSWCKMYKKFVASIGANKKNIYLGRYDTTEEARAAYLEAKKKYHIMGQ